MLVIVASSTHSPKNRVCVRCPDTAIRPRVWFFSVTCLHFAKSYGWPSRECDGSDPAFRIVFPAILVVSLPVSTGLDPSFRLVCCPVQTGKWFWVIVPLLESCYVSFDLPTQTQTEDLLSPDLYRSWQPNINVSPAFPRTLVEPVSQVIWSWTVAKSLKIIEHVSRFVIHLWFFKMARQHSVKRRRTWWNYEVSIQRPASSSQQSIARGWVRSSGKISW